MTKDSFILVSIKFNLIESGDCTEFGVGNGEGLKVNIPWNTPEGPAAEGKIVDMDYVQAFNQIVLPIVKEFSPELLIISAGFDALKGDKLGKISLSPWVCYWMTQALLEINPRVLVTLEGGYNLKMLTKGTDSCISALLGIKKEMPKEVAEQEPTKEGLEAIERVKATMGKYWKCLKA